MSDSVGRRSYFREGGAGKIPLQGGYLIWDQNNEKPLEGLGRANCKGIDKTCLSDEPKGQCGPRILTSGENDTRGGQGHRQAPSHGILDTSNYFDLSSGCSGTPWRVSRRGVMPEFHLRKSLHTKAAVWRRAAEHGGSRWKLGKSGVYCSKPATDDLASVWSGTGRWELILERPRVMDHRAPHSSSQRTWKIFWR